MLELVSATNYQITKIFILWNTKCNVNRTIDTQCTLNCITINVIFTYARRHVQVFIENLEQIEV